MITYILNGFKLPGKKKYTKKSNGCWITDAKRYRERYDELSTIQHAEYSKKFVQVVDPNQFEILKRYANESQMACFSEEPNYFKLILILLGEQSEADSWGPLLQQVDPPS